MHGRLKVRTTAEQDEIKRKEREKKSIAFTNGMSHVFQNRNIEKENESNLKISQKLLSGNPDVSTLWNIRKEIFLNMLTREGNIDELFHEELMFLQNCLLVNPKSYGVWNQRVFVLKNMIKPNWNEELKLCDLFLKHDARNFHCWDYRRYVVKNANITPEAELEFSMKKITENFSNYSSWHYRSKLLPLIYPDEVSPGRVKEEVLLKEFELAQNAFFTDPNDQSAWFYQRWLLGRKEVSPKILSVILERDPSRIIVSFSSPVNLLNSSNEHSCVINNERIVCDWKTSESLSSSNARSKYSCVWVTEYKSRNDKLHLSLQLPFIKNSPEFIKLFLHLERNSVSCSWNKDEITTISESKVFGDAHTDAKMSILNDELEACKMLLDEEPDNKWTMLTIVYLMHALDTQAFENEINELFTKLITVDPMRKGYFKDLQSKYKMEIEIEKIYESKCSIENVDLSCKSLTVFHYPQYFTTTQNLNLDHNQLSTVVFKHILPFSTNITVENNLITPSELEKLNVLFKEKININ